MELLQNIIELDKELLLFINGFHSDFWDTIILMVTCKDTWFPFFGIILFYLFKNYRSKSWLVVLALALAILCADQLAGVLKVGVARLRPVYEPSIDGLVHNVLRKGALYGFVSAHAANAAAVLVIMSRVFKSKSYFFLMLFWAILFMYSRIYFGVHYPLDIICGALLGLGVGYLVYKLMMFVENHFFFSRSPKIERTFLSAAQSRIIYLVFGVGVALVFIQTYLLHHYNYL